MALASFSATIGGATKAISDVRYTSVINGVGEAAFVVDDATGTYVPADDADVVLTVGGAAAWNGEVAEVDVAYLGEAGVSSRVTGHDAAHLAVRTAVNGIYPSQSLKTTLTAVASLLGIGLAAGQVTGPTLGEITTPWWTVETLLNHLASLTGYVWRINATPELEMWAVGSRASGVTLSKANGNVISASWRRQRFDYCNSVWVLWGPSAAIEYVEDNAEVVAKGVWSKVVSVPDVLTATEAAAYGQALIDAGLPRPQMPVIVTRTGGVDPGETVVIDLPDVGLSSVTALVQRVDVTLVKAGDEVDPEYTLTCAAGDVAMPTAIDLWRRMITGASTGSAVVAGGGGGSVTTVSWSALEGDLGGSRQVGVTHSTWVPTREYRDWECPADGTYRALVEVWTAHAGTSVTPRVYDVTGAAAAATDSVAQTSTTPIPRTLTFSAVAGRAYRLELLPGNTSADVFGLGKVRT